MNDLFERHRRDSKSTEVRRLLATVVALGALSGIWYALRGTLITWNAGESFGCYARDSLIRAGLRHAGYEILEDELLHDGYWPAPGWAAWTSAVKTVSFSYSSHRSKPTFTTLVDSRFRLIGKYPGHDFNGSPMDIDGDGFWEVLVRLYETPEPGETEIYYAVIRMRESKCELVWLGVYDISRASGRFAVLAKWEDTNNDGMSELVFFKLGSVTANVVQVAVFAMDRVGGLLRTKSIVENSGLTIWDPPDDVPVTVDVTTDLMTVFWGLLPPPS